MTNLVLSLIVIVLCGIWYTLNKVLHVLNDLTYESADEFGAVLEAHESTPDVHEEPINYADLTVDEIAHLTREQNFDERIARIKDELANKVADSRPSTSRVADELHPAVHNLPHNIIMDYNTLPDVEITI
jgi:hypothetical protein